MHFFCLAERFYKSAVVRLKKIDVERYENRPKNEWQPVVRLEKIDVERYKNLNREFSLFLGGKKFKCVSISF